MQSTSIRQDSEKAPFFVSEQFLDSGKSRAGHAFFGRQGGVSRDLYNALNVGFGSDDVPANVRKNREIIAETIGAAAPENILTLHQIHSNICLKVDAPWSEYERPQADAHVTDKAGIVLGVLTADCAPVLFYGEKLDGSPVIGGAHAGWKGAVGGVLENTLAAMQELGADMKTVRACVGPCIAQVSYEVSESFFAPFEAEDPENEHFFMASNKAGHLMFDLAGYCAAKLARFGVRSVFIKDLDTYFNEEDFFSYRRATHRAEKDYGRQISLIYIKKG